MPRLRRVSGSRPGITRRRRGKGFTYLAPDGTPASPADRERARGLVIPPAWRDVWISPDPDGHIQATGRDARGRKQYIYHPRWRLLRDGDKFDRLAGFGRRLPDLRDRVRADLRRDGLPKEKVLAAVVRLMERSFIRVGSLRYAEENGSYGASTLRKDHVQGVTGREVLLRFQGKGGKLQEVRFDDPRLAHVVDQCRDQPGQHLFSYDHDGPCRVDSDDVNGYIRDAMGDRFTAKDLRTWSASVLMLHRLMAAGPRPNKRARHAVLRAAIKEVAGCLNNTPAVCRKSYLHPYVGTSYLEGDLEERVQGARSREGLWPEEAKLLALLASYRHEAPE